MTPFDALLAVGAVACLIAAIFSYWIFRRQMPTETDSKSSEALLNPDAASKSEIVTEGANEKSSKLSFEKNKPSFSAFGEQGLQGTLAQIPLSDLVQFVALGRKSGLLEIVNGRRHGYLRFVDGQMLAGTFRGRSGPFAVLQMLDLTEGDFEFLEKPGAHPPDYIEEGTFEKPIEVVDILLQWEAARKNQPRRANTDA